MTNNSFTPASEPVACFAHDFHSHSKVVAFDDVIEALQKEREAGRRERDAEVSLLKAGAARSQMMADHATDFAVSELVEALRRVATSMRWPDEGQAWCYSLDEATHDTLHAVLAKHRSGT